VRKISLKKGARALSANKVTELDHGELALTVGDCLFLNNGHQPPGALIVWVGMILFLMNILATQWNNFLGNWIICFLSIIKIPLTA
jgi:hypothetical protein